MNQNFHLLWTYTENIEWQMVTRHYIARYTDIARNSWLWPQLDTGHCSASQPCFFSQHHCPTLNHAIITYCPWHCKSFLSHLPKFTPTYSNQFPRLQSPFWHTNIIKNSCSFVLSFIHGTNIYSSTLNISYFLIHIFKYALIMVVSKLNTWTRLWSSLTTYLSCLYNHC